MDQIFIEGLQVYGYHGVYEQEKNDGQMFLVDCVIETSFAEAVHSDDLSNTVDYGNVCLFIKKYFTEVIIPVTVTTCVSIVPPALAYTYMGGHPVWRFFVVGTLCAVSVCGFSFLICTSRGEKAFIISRIQKFAGKALKKI